MFVRLVGFKAIMEFHLRHRKLQTAAKPVSSAAPQAYHHPLAARVRAAGNRATAAAVLQRSCACGGGAGHCQCEDPEPHSTPPIQPKLIIGTPGDPYEIEADRVADTIASQPDGRVQRKCSCGATGNCQCGAVVETGLEGRLARASAGGKSFDADVRDSFESRLGGGFGEVRIHNDGNAAALNTELESLAFTRGNHVFFAPGQFNPRSAAGQRLLAHELTHVIQQTAGPARTRDASPGCVIQRQWTGGGGSFGGGGASGSWDEPEIELVRMSCAAKEIDFHHTSGSVDRYRLTRCDLTDGEYQAEVTVHENTKTVEFDVGGTGRARVRFRFGYRIARGQPNPITFFRRQRRVRIVVGPLPPVGASPLSRPGGAPAGTPGGLVPPLVCSRPLAVRGLGAFRHAFVFDPPYNYAIREPLFWGNGVTTSCAPKTDASGPPDDVTTSRCKEWLPHPGQSVP